eukprot:scaffold49935_cov66-Phaeocystis_antarctica.AAC.1
MAAWPVAMIANSPSRSSSSAVSVTPELLPSAVAAEPCVYGRVRRSSHLRVERRREGADELRRGRVAARAVTRECRGREVA